MNDKPSNDGRFKSMTQDQAEALLSVVLMDKQGNKKLFDDFYLDILTNDFVCKVLEKRISVCKLPRFEASALAMISILSEGNPGRAVLSLIETMEKFDAVKPKTIDAEFVSTYVYPWGFYTEAEFEKEFDKRREPVNKKMGYNWLI